MPTVSTQVSVIYSKHNMELLWQHEPLINAGACLLQIKSCLKPAWTKEVVVSRASKLNDSGVYSKTFFESKLSPKVFTVRYCNIVLRQEMPASRTVVLCWSARVAVVFFSRHHSCQSGNSACLKKPLQSDILSIRKHKTEQSRSDRRLLQNYFEVTEEGGGMLEFPFNVEGDHPWTSGALSLHQFVLGVRGQACVDILEKHKKKNSQVVIAGYFYLTKEWATGGLSFHKQCVSLNIVILI